MNHPRPDDRAARAVDARVAAFRRRTPLRAGSLIITIFGDAIAPRGGSVWIGSLIAFLAGFGIGDRLVRTSMFRLSRDGWLARRQVGRRSYYALTASGRRRFEAATRRIYAAGPPEWDGEWCLVLVPGGDRERRDALRRELGWLGFGAIAPNVLAHPAPDMQAVSACLDGLDVGNMATVLRARGASGRRAPMRDLVGACWDLHGLEAGYRTFLSDYQDLEQAVRGARAPTPEHCLRARVLLIHDYRRLLLRDPQLPTELLPAGWPGAGARTLCRELYGRLLDRSEAWLSACMETADGPLPPADASLRRRFGGL